MRLYRVFPHDPAARPGAPGHVDHTPPQGRGRWDNPERYVARYFAASPEGAVGEAFGNLAEWSPAMFEMPGIGRRALAAFEAPEGLRRFDFDDARNLVRIGVRPSRVVARDTARTQRLAAELFESGEWDGVAWWSFHWPDWTNVMLWDAPEAPAPVELRSIERLDLGSPSVQEARAVLGRKLVR